MIFKQERLATCQTPMFQSRVFGHPLPLAESGQVRLRFWKKMSHFGGWLVHSFLPCHMQGGGMYEAFALDSRVGCSARFGSGGRCAEDELTGRRQSRSLSAVLFEITLAPGLPSARALGGSL